MDNPNPGLHTPNSGINTPDPILDNTSQATEVHCGFDDDFCSAWEDDLDKFRSAFDWEGDPVLDQMKTGVYPNSYTNPRLDDWCQADVPLPSDTMQSMSVTRTATGSRAFQYVSQDAKKEVEGCASVTDRPKGHPTIQNDKDGSVFENPQPLPTDDYVLADLMDRGRTTYAKAPIPFGGKDILAEAVALSIGSEVITPQEFDYINNFQISYLNAPPHPGISVDNNPSYFEPNSSVGNNIFSGIGEHTETLTNHTKPLATPSEKLATPSSHDMSGSELTSAEPPKPACSRVTKTRATSSTKKPKLWQQEEPLKDKEAEKKRRDAIRSKKNRNKMAAEMSELKAKNEALEFALKKEYISNRDLEIEDVRIIYDSFNKPMVKVNKPMVVISHHTT